MVLSAADALRFGVCIVSASSTDDVEFANLVIESVGDAQ